MKNLTRARTAMGVIACALVASVTLQFVVPAFAQVALAPTASTSVDLAGIVAAVGSLVVSGVSVVAYFFLQKVVTDANARTVLLGAIENGTKWGLAKVAGALPNQALSVNVGSQVAAAALQHVIDTVPGALAQHGNDFAGVVRIALGKLSINGQIDDTTINQIIATATATAPVAAADVGQQLLAAAPAFAEAMATYLANRGKPAAAAPTA